MDDIIVILLTLVIMVVGAISQIKKNKKQPVDEPGREQDSVENNFWDEWLGNEEKQTQYIPDAEPSLGMVSEEKSAVPRSQPLMDSIQSEGIPVVERNVNPPMQIKKINAMERKLNLPEGFSLKKAVIFSEILNSKYF